MSGVLTIKLNDTASMEKADAMIKKILGCLSLDEVNMIEDCTYQELVMSIDMPLPTDNQEEDYGV